MKHIFLIISFALASISLSAQSPQELTEKAMELYDNQNYAEAASLMEKAAEQNYAEAQKEIGCYYLYGLGVPADIDKTVMWLQRAADQNDPTALFLLGSIYGHFGNFKYPSYMDYGKALECLNKSADLGNPYAMNALGNVYATGMGADIDMDKAMHYHKLAAETGISDSMLFLGNRAKDREEAFNWYLKSANLGNKLAMTMVGMEYFSVNESYSDPIEGLSWIALAAELDDSNSQRFMGAMCEFGTFLPKNIEKAKEWYTLSAQNGNEDALNDLKVLNENISK